MAESPSLTSYQNLYPTHTLPSVRPIQEFLRQCLTASKIEKQLLAPQSRFSKDWSTKKYREGQFKGQAWLGFSQVWSYTI